MASAEFYLHVVAENDRLREEREVVADRLREIARVIEETMGDDEDASVWPESIREMADYLSRPENERG